MQIYFPIAEISVNVFLLLGLGGFVGFLSGLFGIGGGFLMAPFLIFIGVPPAVAVATGTNEIVATSVSGVLAHWRRQNVDFKMGVALIVGGVLGSVAGVQLFTYFRSLGQLDLIIALSYVIFLGAIGSLMFAESTRAVFRRRRYPAQRQKLHQHHWVHGLPFKMRFHRSKLYISVLLPIGVGFVIGVLVGVLGLGGGFILIPAMIYLIGMPTAVVVGTSLFQIIFVTATATFLQAYYNQTVDILLALLLLVGGVIGAQLGSRFGGKLQSDELRILLAFLVLLVCGRMVWDLVITPADVFSLNLVSP
ncbi:MAG: sulfite exporter TauE/SafE family protein [Pseudomonadota bacterium]